MESGVDDAGLHSPLLGGYTATEAPPNTPHGAQGSSTTPSALPHGSGLGRDPQQPHAQHQAQPQFQQRHGSPQAIPYAPNAPFGKAMPNVYSQPTAYNGTPQMHGHSIMPQHNMPQLYNIAPQHMHAYTPRYTAAAIPPYQMGKQHSAVIQQALLQQLQGQAGHMGAQWMHTGPQYGMLGATTPNAYTVHQPGSAPPGYPAMPHNAYGAGTPPLQSAQSAQWVPPSPSAMPHANQFGPATATVA